MINRPRIGRLRWLGARRRISEVRPGQWPLRSHRVVAPLLRQIDAAREGVRICRVCANGRLDARSAYRDISTVEHAGDSARYDLVQALASSIITPLDREDLFRLSRHLDDVLDELRDLVHVLELYRVASRAELDAVFDAIGDSLDGLEAAISALTDGQRGGAVHALKVSKGISGIRRLQRRTIGETFGDSGLLEGRAILALEMHRQVDRVVTALDGAASTLADGMIKRG